ncbi:MAG: apolipoprotein N-acyltransferase [Thermodesulfobacteriota bacterium]|nr:apolipoprotein N-acyltransferase [Thermodesulfobacteriota bacterium]
MLLFLSFPKWEFSFLIMVALIPLYFSIEDETPFFAFTLGLTTGITFYMGLLYWIIITMKTYGGLPYVLSCFILFILALYLALYPALFSFLLSIFRIRAKRLSFFLAPFIWIILEYLCIHLFTGFPWGILGYALYKKNVLIQIADITGVHGISFFILLSNGIFWELLRHYPLKKRKFPAMEFLFFLALLMVISVYGIYRLKSNKYDYHEKKVKVGIVQGNIRQDMKWDKDYVDTILKKYNDLTKKLFVKKPDIIVWPETATPFYLGFDSGYSKEIYKLSAEGNVYLLCGSLAFKFLSNDYKLTNTAFLISPENKIIDRYDKIHLVPFGEYVPLKRFLFFVYKLVEEVGDLVPGNEFKVFLCPFGKFSTLICYEVIFPDIARRMVKNGAGFITNITNDAWYGKTAAPYQHLAISTLRAVENRRYLVRAANTGISAIISPEGKIIRSTPLFTNAVISDTVSLKREITFYTEFGDLLVYAGFFIFLFKLFIIYRK